MSLSTFKARFGYLFSSAFPFNFLLICGLFAGHSCVFGSSFAGITSHYNLSLSKKFKTSDHNTKDMGENVTKISKTLLKISPTTMHVLMLIILLSYGNVDKKFKLSILNRSRENNVSPTSCLTDRRTHIMNYILNKLYLLIQ